MNTTVCSPACGPSPLVSSSSGTTAKSCATRMATASRPPVFFLVGILHHLHGHGGGGNRQHEADHDAPPSRHGRIGGEQRTERDRRHDVHNRDAQRQRQGLRNDCSRSSMPMMNSSISTPRSARVSIESERSIRPNPVGPSTTPTRMNPAAAGSLSRFMNSPQITAAAEHQGQGGQVLRMSHRNPLAALLDFLP